MPKRKQRATVPEVEAVQMSEEELAAAMPSLMRLPVALAHPQESQSSSRKTSRVHEAFTTDPTDSSRCLCQSTENVVGGGVCNENIGKVRSPRRCGIISRGQAPTLGDAEGLRWQCCLGHERKHGRTTGGMLARMFGSRVVQADGGCALLCATGNVVVGDCGTGGGEDAQRGTICRYCCEL